MFLLIHLLIRSSWSVPLNPFLSIRSSWSVPLDPFLLIRSSWSVPLDPLLLIHLLICSSWSIPLDLSLLICSSWPILLDPFTLISSPLSRIHSFPRQPLTVQCVLLYFKIFQYHSWFQIHVKFSSLIVSSKYMFLLIHLLIRFSWFVPLDPPLDLFLMICSSWSVPLDSSSLIFCWVSANLETKGS